MRAITSRLRRILLAVLCIGAALPAAALFSAALQADEAPLDDLLVAVASNFRPAMEEAARRFQRQTGHAVRLSFGSTGKQYAQIVNGAPFDAFFAADAERPQRLEREGYAVPGSRFTFAIGQLVLWSREEGLVDARGEVLRQAPFRHLAIANPDLAPYGAAARDVLLSLGLWERLESKLVRGENIGQTFQFVISGNAELGFVASSQLAVPGRQTAGSSWIPPQDFYPPIEQQAVLLRDSDAGRAFMAFMQSDAVADILRTYGYQRP